jgi:hypothetical protein
MINREIDFAKEGVPTAAHMEAAASTYGTQIPENFSK